MRGLRGTVEVEGGALVRVRPSTMSDPTRPSLIERLGDAGDHQAWQEFDELYGDLLLRFARKSGLAAPDAEDVRQEVLLALVRRMGSFEYEPARGRFRDYLGRAVRHAVFRRLGQGAREPERLATEVEPDSADWREAEKRFEREWADQHLRRALEHVRGEFEARSMAIFEALLAGVPGHEVAQRFESTPFAVAKVKSRVRARLAERVAEQVELEG